MRPLLLAALLPALGCSETPASGVRDTQPSPPAPLEAQLPTPFSGDWRVTAVDGQPAPPRHSPILISVGSAAVGARADCVRLGETRFVVRGGAMTLTPPPPSGPVAMCARGLSTFESAFSEVFRTGAVGRLRDGRLVLERGGRTIEAVRDR